MIIAGYLSLGILGLLFIGFTMMVIAAFFEDICYLFMGGIFLWVLGNFVYKFGEYMWHLVFK